MSMADRIVVMSDGRIAQVGTPMEIYRDPSSAYVADFIGSMNFLHGKMGAGGQVHVGKMKISLPDGAGKQFACRHCYNLAYEVQREHYGHRAARRAHKLRKRLGVSPALDGTIPVRPKGMHHHTYERLMTQLAEAELTSDICLSEFLARLTERL